MIINLNVRLKYLKINYLNYSMDISQVNNEY